MVGKTIAHYEITAKIGEGGMGVVYRARDTKLGRDAALKVPPVQFARDLARMARCEREARIGHARREIQPPETHVRVYWPGGRKPKWRFRLL